MNKTNLGSTRGLQYMRNLVLLRSKNERGSDSQVVKTTCVTYGKKHFRKTRTVVTWKKKNKRKFWGHCSSMSNPKPNPQEELALENHKVPQVNPCPALLT